MRELRATVQGDAHPRQRGRQIGAIAALLVGGFGVKMPGAMAAATCPASLAAAVEGVIEQPQWARSHWGIVVAPPTGEPIYNHNGAIHTIAASNVKLFTTAAALLQFGPDFQISTPIYSLGTAPRLDRLHLSGRGDPSLKTADLTQWAQALRSQGVRHIEQLTVDDAVPASAQRPDTWEQYDLNFYYGMAVNRLMLNDNAFQITLLPQGVGEAVRLESDDAIALRQWDWINQGVTAPDDTPYSMEIRRRFGTNELTITGELAANAGRYSSWGMAVFDPTAYFLATLRFALNRAGITVADSAIAPPPDIAPSTTHLSPTLASLVHATNQPSNNLYAEALLQQLGPGEAGLTAIAVQLSNIGVDSDAYALVDGSGLSRHTLVSPDAIVQLLQAMTQQPPPIFVPFIQSLPISGTSGTLRRRLTSATVRGQIAAKTGTMTGVSALSGYLRPSSPTPLVFSIVVNRTARSVQEQREAIDAMMEAIATWQRCQSEHPSSS
ncbi:D-alanyl-D-alanine carboxypeptidase/D-alanyl-D-alanine endopeptidase [Spirulina major]|uniref:D-alanyl-D-alanine carboxypeptidase/D-alanyl-D-alanine endopeptidase n=1 Tax=Spirulina major TaxID=270636 RepID=UPI000A953F7E|nr:D-alanyl-D-alanine carboxypeptidase/D-alanyl-D-alanine-endopeptidase [Spirulina major]